ncbi:phosphate signaling complex protein PhoU [Kineosporia sp. NBRC 101731]|uniref:phosphate signaling complex protein PhoU n=1 Tax=Kineosporia sp. NBRC 101731 TaxID=3032199 RepID=UPI0024A269D4|nr:phosphate signaling complex protein PhoU [Kineosporia sp. NBRC 101731]GLY29996.1 phosphate transport system regulatory protein PhoU [Kineosporia sp. NBRC 101731]
MTGIRDSYQSDLFRVDEILLQMCDLAEQSARGATAALVGTDVARAEQVIDLDRGMDMLHQGLENRLLRIMARWAPVAGDLRSLLAALRVGADLARMGGLARHVAELVRRRYPRCAAPGVSCDLVREMGEIAVLQTTMTRDLLETHDVRLVSQVAAVDDRMDSLHRKLLATLIDPDWPHGVEPAVDLTLLGRFYERFGDHTVTIAHQVHFIVLGSLPEPRPRESIESPVMHRAVRQPVER